MITMISQKEVNKRLLIKKTITLRLEFVRLLSGGNL